MGTEGSSARTKEPRCLPNKMVVATASRSHLEIMEVTEKIGRESERCLHIGADRVEATGDTQGDETKEEGNIPTILTVDEVGV